MATYLKEHACYEGTGPLRVLALPFFLALNSCTPFLHYIKSHCAKQINVLFDDSGQPISQSLIERRPL